MMNVPAYAVADDLLGDVVQICLVTRDQKRTMTSLSQLGIGPWRVQTLGPANVTDMRFGGNPHSFKCKMAYAYSTNMMWEVVEPLEGTGVFDDFLEKHGEGIHHVGFLCPNRSFTEAIAEFRRRGFEVIQSGRVWNGQVGYAFIETCDALGHFFEIWDHPPGFTPPEPEEWFPAPPVDATVQ